MRKYLYLLSIYWLLSGFTVWANVDPKTEVLILSPDNNLQFHFFQKNENGALVMYYTINYKDDPLILPSRLGIEMDNRVWESAMAYTPKVDNVESWCDNLAFKEVIYDKHNETWTPVYGERSIVKDNYNSAIISLAKPDQSNYKMDIEVRAYNEGIAFRYTFPMHPDAIYNKITADLTEYVLPDETKTWCTKWAQGTYEELTLPEWEKGVAYERPLTLQLPNNKWAALTDANTSDWCLLNFIRSESKNNTIGTQMYETIDMLTPYATPWKVVMTADEPGKLLENNDIVLNLNPPCEIVDTRWIKPGKIMREMTLTTENAIDCIDFCKQHNMQYILFDWKWYGPAFDYASDASQVIAPIDMHKVISYGKEKGIGVWVYVNQHALEKQARRIFPLFKEWGIAGVKFGFVQFKTHRWATWMHDAVRLTAENNLLVNIHDEYRPSGFNRTYPNLLTQEGIRGNEEFPDATHNTILPFTRMIAGAGDYTVCYFDPRLKNTHAHQLALPVIFYSPLQTLYWYDTPERIVEVPELEFFDKVPVSFDDTKVIHDKMGEYVTIARRNNKDWFLGTLSNNEARNISTPLDFLDIGQMYVANIYTDDNMIQTKTQVRVTRIIVDNKTILNFRLKPRGGCTVHFTPMTKDNAKGLKVYSKTQIL